MACAGKSGVRAVCRGYNEAHKIAVLRGRLYRKLWAPVILACPVCFLLALTGVISSVWLERWWLAVMALEVVTIPRAVAIYRRRSRE
jgi:hypothetical protein